MAHNKDAGAGAATAEQLLAYARVERDRAAQRAADRARLAEAVAPADGGGGGEALAAAEAALAKSEAAALAAFAGQGGGPCAYTRVGEALIDVLADVAVAGFAAELAPARFLCNETFEVREPGAVADVLRNALEAQCGARAARAARRGRAELPTADGKTERAMSTTQLIRAAARGEDARMRALVALGAPLDCFEVLMQRFSAGGVQNWSRPSGWTALMRASALGNSRCVEALVAVPGRAARIDQRDNESRTALMLAASRGHAATVAVLLKHGAGSDKPDANGWTALMYASSCRSGAGGEAVARLLLARGARTDLVNERPSLFIFWGTRESRDGDCAGCVNFVTDPFTENLLRG